MVSWQFWLVFSLILFILEIFTPALFFLNIAIAAIITSIVSFLGFSMLAQSLTLAIMSLVLILILRPYLLKIRTTKNSDDVINEKYIGNIAKVIEKIDKFNGRIAIYGEEWEARVNFEEIIDVNCEVRIIKNEGTIMFVEKI